jgi:hypothetical protein
MTLGGERQVSSILGDQDSPVLGRAGYGGYGEFGKCRAAGHYYLTILALHQPLNCLPATVTVRTKSADRQASYTTLKRAQHHILASSPSTLTVPVEIRDPLIVNTFHQPRLW